MGLLLHSSVLVAAERQAVAASTLLSRLQQRHDMAERVLSAVSVVELEHGVYRAQLVHQATQRRNYLDTVFAAIPVKPFAGEITLLTLNLRHFRKIQGLRLSRSEVAILSFPILRSSTLSI